MSNSAEHKRITRLAQECANINLRRATRAISNYYDDLFLAGCGLRATQITQLVVPYLAGPQTINEIADRLGLDRTTLTRNLKLLEEAGLLKIQPGDDQRTRMVTITQQGKNVLRKALPVWEKAQAHVEQGMGKKEFHSLLTQLSEIAELTREK